MQTSWKPLSALQSPLLEQHNCLDKPLSKGSSCRLQAKAPTWLHRKPGSLDARGAMEAGSYDDVFLRNGLLYQVQLATILILVYT